MAEYDIVDISQKFNKSIKQLILIASDCANDNLIFDTIKRKIKIAIDANPLILLQEGGIHIFEYRDYIKNDKFDELFLNTENIITGNDKDLIKKHTSEESEESINGLLSLIKLFREAWHSYSEKEKKIIKKNFKILLSEYCKYLSISK